MEHHAQTLRRVAEHLSLPTVKVLIREPSVRDVYRITIAHGDAQTPTSVATLIRRTTAHAPNQPGTSSETRLDIRFHGALGGKRLVYNISEERYHAVVVGLQNAAFDKLGDQPDLPFYGAEIWLIERGAGSFVKSLLLAPQTATGVYATIIALIRTQLPEALRQLH